MNAGSPQPLMPHGWDERHRVRTARIAQRPSGMMCARREAGARRPALSTSAPSTSAESPRAPEPRRGRFGARLFLLPALALLLGAISLFAVAPAEAQVPQANRLTALSLSVGGSSVTLSPSFAGATTNTYTATVAYDVNSVTVTATWTGSKTVSVISEDPVTLAQITSPIEFASSGSSVSVNLNPGGPTNLDFSVDQTGSVYIVRINRRPAQGVAPSPPTGLSATAEMESFTVSWTA